MRPEVQRPRSDHDKVTSCWYLLPGKGHGEQDTKVRTSQVSLGMTQSHIVS